jgi:hypothetical protein
LRKGARWLAEPEAGIVALIDASGNDDIPNTPRFGRYTIGSEAWWLRRLDYITSDDTTYVAYIGLHVSPMQDLLALLGGTMAFAGVLGVLASAALGWWAPAGSPGSHRKAAERGPPVGWSTVACRHCAGGSPGWLSRSTTCWNGCASPSAAREPRPTGARYARR